MELQIPRPTPGETIEMRVRKGRDGWRAESTVILGPVADGVRVLNINTWKMTRGLETHFSCAVRKDGFETHALFGDFSKRYPHHDVTRVTEKSVTERHRAAIGAVLSQMIEQAKAFYAAQDADAAAKAEHTAPFPGAKLVTEKATKVETITGTREEFMAAMAARGYTPMDEVVRSPRVRMELQGAPYFRQLVGPSWDGGVWRYEDSETSDILSR